MKINKNNLNIFLFFIFIFSVIYIKFLIETFYFGAMPMHDTLWSYLNFQYAFNYLDHYRVFPNWIQTNTGGHPLYGIINFSSSFFVFPIIYLSKFLGINSYYAYLFLMSVFLFLFVIGIFFFIKENTKNYFLIFFLVYFSFILSSDYFFISQSNWWYTLIPLQIYFADKYFKTSNEKYLFYLINSQLIFSVLYWTYYNIFTIYFLIILIIIFCFTHKKFLINKINFKKLIFNNFFQFLFLLILLTLNLVIFKYFQDNYYVNTPFRLDNFSLSNYGFIGNIPLAYKFKKIIFGEYTQSFYTIGITNIVLIFLTYILFNIKIFIKNSLLVGLLISIIFIILISSGDEFLLTKLMIESFRLLPFMDTFKHYGYIMHFLTPVILLIVCISINQFLKSKNKIKILYACLLVFLFKLFCFLIFFDYFQDHYENNVQKKILINLFLSFILLTVGFYFFIFFEKVSKIYYFFIFLIICSILPNYNLAFQKYTNFKNQNIFDKFYINNNIAKDRECLIFEDAVQKFSYFKDILSLPGNKYNIINLNLENKICNPFAKIPVDGSKKSNSKYFHSGQSLELRNTNVKNSLFLNNIFKDLEIDEDINEDGVVDNEDLYLSISDKTKLSLWTVAFRLQFAENYLNLKNKKNRYTSLKFSKNINGDWIVLVDEKSKNEPLFKIVDNMIIKNNLYKNDNYLFFNNLTNNENIFNFSIKEKGTYNLKLSFNENWKLINVKNNNLINFRNNNGYISFNQNSGADYSLEYKNNLEIFIILCQSLLILILIMIFLPKISKIKI